MSRESEFAARMAADSTLMAILTGGVYQAGLVGIEGITRDTTPAAYSGYLRPCALVRQADKTYTGEIEDYNDQTSSARQRIEIWLYEDSPGYSAIDAAAARIRTLFQGYQLAGTFEIRLANHIERQRDTGSLNGASLERLDFQVDSIVQ